MEKPLSLYLSLSLSLYLSFSLTLSISFFISMPFFPLPASHFHPNLSSLSLSSFQLNCISLVPLFQKHFNVFLRRRKKPNKLSMSHEQNQCFKLYTLEFCVCYMNYRESTEAGELTQVGLHNIQLAGFSLFLSHIRLVTAAQFRNRTSSK